MKKIIYLDASALSKSSCFLRLYRTVVEGWRAEHKHNDTEYGSAFAKFKEALMHNQGNYMEAIPVAHTYFREQDCNIRPNKDHLDIGHLTTTCMSYVNKFGAKREKDTFQIFKDETTGAPLVEGKFAIPYYADKNVQIILSGTMDSIGKFSNGCVAIEDDKTTSSWNRQKYLDAYKLSPQLIFYRLCFGLLAEYLPPGNKYQELMSKHQIGCFVTVAFLAKDKPTEWVRSPVYFYSEQQLEEYKNILDSTISRLANTYYYKQEHNVTINREGMVNGACQTPYGFCDFFNVCSAPEGAVDSMLKGYFVQRPYEPLKFR